MEPERHKALGLDPIERDMTETRGRPRKIGSPEEFDRLVDEYMADRTEREKPITLTGALLHLGLYARKSLDDYEGYEGFSLPVKRLRALVGQSYEERLHGNSPTGAIFALKNMGWSDKQELEHSGKGGGPIVLWGAKSE